MSVGALDGLGQAALSVEDRGRGKAGAAMDGVDRVTVRTTKDRGLAEAGHGVQGDGKLPHHPLDDAPDGLVEGRERDAGVPGLAERLGRAFKSRAEKAGVRVIPVHATRRTCAGLLVALDVHPRVAMAVLRHSRIALTMEVYSHVSSFSTREARSRLAGELTVP